MSRQYFVTRDGKSRQVYNGFDTNPAGSHYQLGIGERRCFYCQERDLALAICEVARYGKEQWNWNPPVQVTPLPSLSQ